MSVEPKPFYFAGGKTGCLLVHGFTGSPPEMLLLGEYLAQQGFTVSAPLLAGHGTQPEDLNRVRWQDWVASAQDALLALMQSCERVVVAGLSMGALVCVHLAYLYPEIAAMALYAPALRAANRLVPLAVLLRYVIKSVPASSEVDLVDPEAPSRLWHYPVNPVGGVVELWRLQRVVYRELPQVSTPTLVFNTTRDAAIHPRSAQVLFDRLGTKDKKLVILHNSGHCMTVDAERDLIFAETQSFFRAHVSTA